MVKAFPLKRIADFFRQKQTKEFIEKLETRYRNPYIGSKTSGIFLFLYIFILVYMPNQIDIPVGND